MRKYIVFGSDDGEAWVSLGVVDAGGHTQAMGQFRERTNYAHYASCPLRNWASATPQVKQRAPVVTWEPLSAEDRNQLVWDETLKETPKEKESPSQAARRIREDLVEERTP